MNENKRVILITGDGKKWYEQAIFIVRKDCLQNEMPKDFIQEAEKIVNNYMSNLVPVAASSEITTRNKNQNAAPLVRTTAKRKDTKRLDYILNIFMFVCCATLLVLFCLAYFT